MQVDGVSYRTIWLSGDGRTVDIIDQTLLPHDFRIVRLETLETGGGVKPCRCGARADRRDRGLRPHLSLQDT
jgi:hypothetical protein